MRNGENENITKDTTLTKDYDNINVTGNKITVDLGKHTVETLTISGDNVTLKNGTVTNLNIQENVQNVTLENVLDSEGGKHTFAGGGGNSIVLKGETELKGTIDITAKAPIRIRAEKNTAKVTGKVVVKTSEAVIIAVPVENEIEIQTKNDLINIKAKVKKVVALANVKVKVAENVDEKPILENAPGVEASAKVVNDRGEEIETQPEGYDFKENENLKPVNLESDFEFSEGVITGYTGTVTDVIIPEEINGEKVVSIGTSAFKGKKLTSVKLPNTLESIGMFAFAMNKITTIELPKGLAEIGNMAFCNNELTSIKIPNSLTEIPTAAFCNNKLTSIEIPESVTRLAMKAFMNNNLETVVIPSKMENIGVSAFAKNNLGEVTIPSSVKIIGKEAFDANDNIKLTYTILVETLEEVEKVETEGKTEESIKALQEAIEAGKVIDAKPEANLEEVNTVIESITNAINGLEDKQVIEEAWIAEDFEYEGTTLTGFSELGKTKFENNKDLIIPKTNKEGKPITIIGTNAFWRDNNSEDKIKSLVLSNTIEKIENGAFAGNLIESLEIPGSVKSIDEGAFIRNKIKVLTINEGLESIGRLSFANNQLTDLIIPSSMQDLGRRAFYNNKISKLTILPGIEKLGAQCFENNVIQEVDIPKTVKYIDLGAFVYNSLENVKLPEGLKIVGPKSFGVNNLKSVTFPESVEWFCPNAFRKNSGFESGEFKIFIDKIIEVDGDIKESVLKDELNEEINVRAAVFEGLIDETKHKIDIKSWERVREEDEYLIYRGKFEEIPEELLNCGLGSSCENIIENMQMTSLIVKVKLTGELLEPEEPGDPIEPEEPEEPEEPKKETWDAKHFTFEGTTITGFSELGEEKFATDKELIIPEKNTDGQVVDSIGDKAFNLDSFGEDGIKSLALPETIKSIGTIAFRNNNIVNLELPDSVEELGDGVFAANRDLETLELSNNLKKIPQGAFSFSKIEKLVIPEGVIEIGGSAFVGGDLLVDVTIPSTVEKIDYKAFQNIKASSITIPGSVKEIASDAFAGGYLSSLVLEEGIETIGGRAFKRNKLTEVTIPKSITGLYESAFDLNQNINIKYASLIEILEEAEKVDTVGKTEESIKALQEAIEEGKTINAKFEATLEEVNTVVKALQEAIDGLKDINQTVDDNEITLLAS